jgi:hypothetical protein
MPFDTDSPEPRSLKLIAPPSRTDLKSVMQYETPDLADYLKGELARPMLEQLFGAPVIDIGFQVEIAGVKVDAVVTLGEPRAGQKVAVEMQLGRGDLDHLRKVVLLSVCDPALLAEVVWFADGFPPMAEDWLGSLARHKALPLRAIQLQAYRNGHDDFWIEWSEFKPSGRSDVMTSQTVKPAGGKKSKAPAPSSRGSAGATAKARTVSDYSLDLDDALRVAGFPLQGRSEPRDLRRVTVGRSKAFTLEIKIHAASIGVGFAIEPGEVDDMAALAGFLSERTGRAIRVRTIQGSDKRLSLGTDPFPVQPGAPINVTRGRAREVATFALLVRNALTEWYGQHDAG